MKGINYLLLLITLTFSQFASAQSFVNGSFENTTASVACNYNLSNAAFNGLMANTNAYGGGQECDILIAGCFQPSIPDGIRAVGLAHVPLDEIALDLTAPLVAGNSYTISFWSYSEITFRVQGDIEVGVSTNNSSFGTLVYVANTVPMTWVQHTFTFTAPSNATHVTVRNINDGVIHWNHVDHFEFAGCAAPTINLGNDTTVCNGTNLTLDATYAGASYLWQDGSTNPTYTVTAPGQYFVEVTDACGTAYDTINVTYEGAPVFDLGADTTLCPGNNLTLDATSPNSTYLWQDNSTNPTFNVTTAGTYSVDVTNNCGTTNDVINVTYDVLPTVDLGNDTLLCNSATLLLDATYPGATYLWQDNSTNATFNVTGPGVYTVDVTTVCGTVSDAITVTYDSTPTVNLGSDTTLCPGATLLLDATYAGATYLWQDNSTNPTFNVTTAGTYSVDVTNSCGTANDALNVTYDVLPIVDLGNDTSLCPGNTLLLDATYPSSTYLWQDNSTNATFTVSTAGTYSVDVTNYCGTASDAINVTFGSIPTVDLGNDTTLCPGSTLQLDATYAGATYLWQDNSTNATYTVSAAGQYYVDVTTACGTATDTINILYDVMPVVDLGNDTLLCQGATLDLDATFPASTYLWQDNSTNATFTVSTAGTYSVDVTNYCGTVSDAINITYSAPPAVDLGPDTSLCSGAAYILDATTPGVTYLWQDNSTNATLSINQTGLYYVTVTNECGSYTDSVNVDFNALFDIDLGNDTTMCEGQTLVLNANVPNSTTTWQDNTVSQNYVVDEPGVYSATVNVGACVARDTIVITMVPPPVVDLGNDVMICEDEELVLAPIDINPGSYLWNTGSSEPHLLVTEFDTYTLSLTNECGTDMDTIVIGDMGCSCVIYIPNTFTPDGDEFNQQFKAEYDCVFYEYEFHIFNRWGQRIFTSYDPDGIWDGTYRGVMVQQGTYTYTLQYKKDFEAAETTKQTGHINVVY